MVADEDNPEAWRQVAALGDMADTVKDQKNRLLLARDALIQAWPPEKNPAAQAFVDQIDILLRNMDVQKATAEKNAAALGNIVEALRQAKDKVRPLYEQYLAKRDDRVPAWWDHAEEELDEQARKHMVDAEKIVATHAMQITAPPPYRLNVATDVNQRTRGFDSDDDTTSSRRYTLGAPGNPTTNGRSVAVPHDPPPPLPGSEGAASPVTQRSPSGVELAGVAPTTPVMQTHVPPSAAGTLPGPPGGLIQPGMIIGGRALPSVDVTTGARGAMVSGGAPGPFSGGIRGVSPFGSVIRGTSPGSGGISPAKPMPPSWLPATPGQPGVIGGMTQSGLGGTGGRSVADSRMMAGMPNTAGGRSPRNEARDAAFDPDNPWTTAEGVDPVIEPPRHRPQHDPGPGVIGWYG
jgi:hypothetical protein